jgi:hypothetical protein
MLNEIKNPENISNFIAATTPSGWPGFFVDLFQPFGHMDF